MNSRPWQRHYDWDVPTTLRYPRIPVANLLSIPASSYPDKPALIFHENEITFYELRREVFRFANALEEIGVKKGDRVGLQLPTCPQYVIGYYAILSLGAIVTNMNPLYTVHELKYMVEETGVTTIISSEFNIEKVAALCEQSDVQRVVITGTMDFAKPGEPAKLDLPEGWHHFSALLDGCSNTRRPRVDIAPEDPAQIQFTGGTTGIPKGATLTHANVIAASLQVSHWGISGPVETRSVLVVLPYYHIYANICCMAWGIVSSATQILVERFEIDSLMDLLARFDRIDFFPAVPTMITAVLNHPRAEELKLDKKLSLLNSGGGPMPVELIDRVEGLGINYGEGWGMSETTSLGIANPLVGMSKVGSIGIPWPDTDVKIVDLVNGTEEMPIGEPGELIIKSPLVMKEYWGDPEKTADQLRDGWLFTGDIAVRDEDDYFTIVERKKDMIIAGGLNIYPREVEEVLYQHPKILEAVTVGIPDEYRGETVKAFVVLKSGESATDDDIKDFCRERLAPYKIPTIVEFRESLPKSAVGKLLRRALRDEEKQRRAAAETQES